MKAQRDKLDKCYRKNKTNPTTRAIYNIAAAQQSAASVNNIDESLVNKKLI